MSRSNTFLQYVHILPDGKLIHGAHIELSRAESWHTPEGTLYLSATGTTVLKRPNEAHAEYIEGAALHAFCQEHNIDLPVRGPNDAGRENIVRLTVRLGYPLKLRLQREADRKNITMAAVIAELLNENLPPLQETNA